MSIEGQGHFFTIYFPGFVCFVLYLAKISGERLQDHWSSGLYQWLDDVKIRKYTKFEPNMSCGSRVMSIFTKRARPAKMMLDEASSISFIPVAGQCQNAYVYKI